MGGTLRALLIHSNLKMAVKKKILVVLDHLSDSSPPAHPRRRLFVAGGFLVVNQISFPKKYVADINATTRRFFRYIVILIEFENSNISLPGK